jgi:hypothetical protein
MDPSDLRFERHFIGCVESFYRAVLVESHDKERAEPRKSAVLEVRDGGTPSHPSEI